MILSPITLFFFCFLTPALHPRLGFHFSQICFLMFFSVFFLVALPCLNLSGSRFPSCSSFFIFLLDLWSGLPLIDLCGPLSCWWRLGESRHSSLKNTRGLLYTTIINHEEATQATKWALGEFSELKCVKRKFLVNCLKYSLDHNYFWLKKKHINRFAE